MADKSEQIRLRGRYTLRCNGEVIAEGENLVVTVGKNHVADQLLSAPTQATMSHMAIGSGDTAPAAGNTALVTETARVAFGTKTRSTNVVTYVATFGAGVGTGAVKEAGILNAAAAGTMLNRFLVGPHTKGANDTYELTVQLTVG